MADPDFLRELIANPREALAIESKAWIDPKTADGEAKIAKCLLALRNHGGGFMVIGFHNLTSQPTAQNRPADARTTFHADTIQQIVSRYASEPFEVTVHFPERDGFEFPVIEVPAGVKTPVATKSDLLDAGQPIIRKDSVFVRSLNASGVVGSTVAGWKDWSRLVETCFDNREADIGRFLRRHLAGTSADDLRRVVSELVATSDENEEVARVPTISDRVEAIRTAGFVRFQIVNKQRAPHLPPHGWWEIAAVVNGPSVPPLDDLAFLNALLSSNPNLTGWPAWVDSRNFSETDFRPYFVDADNA